jgi:hypothetical protein
MPIPNGVENCPFPLPSDPHDLINLAELVSMEISAKLDEAENKVIEVEDQLKKSDSQNPDNSTLKSNHQDAYLLYMNHWEFYSFLVNNNEIDNKNIKKYFEPNFISGTDRFFNKYPVYWDKENQFEEIKKYLKEIGHEPNVSQ